jgi:hypothetical protein
VTPEREAEIQAYCDATWRQSCIDQGVNPELSPAQYDRLAVIVLGGQGGSPPVLAERAS